jgi:hypothetical protein
VAEAVAAWIAARWPAPCRGDPAFDTVDLLMWQAEDPATVTSRARELGDRIGSPHDRLLQWCAAFASMVACEEAEAASASTPTSERIRMLIGLSRSV